MSDASFPNSLGPLGVLFAALFRVPSVRRRAIHPALMVVSRLRGRRSYGAAKARLWGRSHYRRGAALGATWGKAGWQRASGDWTRGLRGTAMKSL